MTTPSRSLALALRRFRSIYARLSRDETTAAQMEILEAVAKRPAPQSHIIDTTGIDRATLSELLRRMEAQKLVIRSRELRDRRALLVRITPRGHRAYARSARLAVRAEEELLAPLTNALQRSAFLNALEKIA